MAAPAVGPHLTAAARAERAPLLVFEAVLAMAAVVYSVRLGQTPLGASEACSALAAGKPSIAAIVAIPINHDPGKVIGYYVALHFWADVFGTGAVALHAFSVVFSLLAVALLFMVGRELFDDRTGAAAAAIWAFAPYQVALSQRARMYPLVITLALAHLLMLWQARKRPAAERAALAGIFGAALLYTHLGGLLVIGAEAAMLARDLVRGRRSAMPWLALAIALMLFAPILPITMAEARVLTEGQALDWIGAASQYSAVMKLAAAAVALAAAAWIIVGGTIERQTDEPLRWLLGWCALPPIALAAASIVIRPMFNPRYVSSALVASTLLAAAALAIFLGPKVRNLAAAGITTACLLLLPFSYPKGQPWPAVAQMVASAPASEPVFFEAGYVSGVRPNNGFPFGYYTIPFDYYFKGANPRVVVPGYDPAQARRTIDARVRAAGGGWLISWKPDAEAARELPEPARFRSQVRIRAQYLTVYRIEPATS